MKSIFESLENLSVSEECFEGIVGIIEEILNEGDNLAQTVMNMGKNIPTKKLENLVNKAYKIEGTNDLVKGEQGYHQTGDDYKNYNKHDVNRFKYYKSLTPDQKEQINNEAKKAHFKIYKETHGKPPSSPFFDVSDEIKKRRLKRRMNKN